MDKGKTERKWYEIDAQSGAVAEVWIYEEIGSDFWGEGLTAKKFVEDLAALDVEHIALHINSPGRHRLRRPQRDPATTGSAPLNGGGSPGWVNFPQDPNPRSQVRHTLNPEI